MKLCANQRDPHREYYTTHTHVAVINDTFHTHFPLHITHTHKQIQQEIRLYKINYEQIRLSTVVI